ncbi:EAL domain-containing protein [Pseudochrobactrum sp. Wa41.01b-1]|uniref:EAL domain-containing protein n=1 Tax=Pseudochrobactrum sp. Wa41.01b-1 TaxID=2864102 RepID=UPI001C691C49|nr:EAL domain-containing protein [Pseudochrobactrum sp. Wa41.01b-1]QYM71725.1 EAL domain-containing protein [Pseudochrobactrum sp. Wa41.01b-1]
MSRRSIIGVATLFAIIASVLPLIGLSEYQQRQDIVSRQNYVGDYASYTAIRIEQTLNDAKQALTRAQTIKRTDCSPEHRQQMGQVAADSHSIEDVGFFRNNELVCTRLDLISPPVPAHPADMDLGQGYSIHFAEKPVLFEGQPRIELRHGEYGVLVTPGRFIDLVGYTDMIVGVATDQGKVLEQSASADPEVIKSLISGRHLDNATRYTFASHPVQGLVAFAFVRSDRHGTTVSWRYILPLGVTISLLLIGIIIWVSRLQLSPEKALEQAVRNREFIVHYQPIMDLMTGRCVAAEALVRWRLNDGRMMPPDHFIPLAEASGLVSSLTDLVIEIVTTEMGPLLRDNAELHISINIPARDMESGRFLSVLTAAVEKVGIEPSQIWLEVTERGFMNADAATKAIEKARAAGYRIAIDDFGTGYSSLALLEGLPLDALKIDKAFVDAIGHDSAPSIVTTHIIGMARELKLALIAEGVETSQQESYLKNANVQFGQGWLYAKALPADKFRVFYRSKIG